MSESTKYKAIKGWIAAKMAFKATYKNKPRTLCPHVLGYKHETGNETDEFERVLCYQVAGPDPEPCWRCFNVITLTINGPDPSTPFQTGPNYAGKKWQASVKNAKHVVP